MTNDLKINYFYTIYLQLMITMRRGIAKIVPNCVLSYRFENALYDMAYYD